MDASDGVLTELALDGGSLLATVQLGATGNLGASVAVGAGSIWVTDTHGGRVIRVDPASRLVVARIPVGPGPKDITADEQGVWVTR